MIKYLLGGAGAAALVAIAPAIAQTAPPAPQPLLQRAPMAVHTRAEVGTHVQALFARLDTNRDGYITKAEVEARRGERRERIVERIQRRGGMAGPAADRAGMFDRMDTNRDGSISRAEFEAAPVRHERRIVIAGDRPAGARNMRGMRMGLGHFGGQMFDLADANRDGRVSLQEATASAYRHFDMADANRDGQLTREERRQMHQRMRAERRRG